MGSTALSLLLLLLWLLLLPGAGSGSYWQGPYKTSHAGPRLPARGSWYTGRYRNLFVESGLHTQTEVDEKVQAAYNQLFHGDASSERLFYYTSAEETEAYILSVDSSDVRSEGMSYGMMIAVQMDSQKEFDALFAFAKAHMQHTSPSDPRYGYFGWRASPQGQLLDDNSAPDGETYIVTALFFAAYRWGDHSTAWGYSEEADLILSASISKGNSGSSKGGVTNMFNTNLKQVVFVPFGDTAGFTDPSYVVPAFYTVWSTAASSNNEFWAQVANASRAFFPHAADDTTALCPDYSTFSGQPTGGMHTEFRYDAWRCAQNIATDFAWLGAPQWGPRAAWPSRFATTLHAFFQGQNQSKPYGNCFTLAGYELAAEHKAGLVAMNAVAALAATEKSAWDFVEELFNVAVPVGKYRYYDGLLYFLGLLHVAGRFQIWADTSRPIPGNAPLAPPSRCDAALAQVRALQLPPVFLPCSARRVSLAWEGPRVPWLPLLASITVIILQDNIIYVHGCHGGDGAERASPARHAQLCGIAELGPEPTFEGGARRLCYRELETTCRQAVAVSGELTVDSIAACQGRCDAQAATAPAGQACVGIDVEIAPAGQQGARAHACYLKSRCLGTVGQCVQPGTNPMCGFRQVEHAEACRRCGASDGLPIERPRPVPLAWILVDTLALTAMWWWWW
jgi:oligosaccharide reducing-end xylanase